MSAVRVNSQYVIAEGTFMSTNLLLNPGWTGLVPLDLRSRVVQSNTGFIPDKGTPANMTDADPNNIKHIQKHSV